MACANHTAHGTVECVPADLVFYKNIFMCSQETSWVGMWGVIFDISLDYRFMKLEGILAFIMFKSFFIKKNTLWWREGNRESLALERVWSKRVKQLAYGLCTKSVLEPGRELGFSQPLDSCLGTDPHQQALRLYTTYYIEILLPGD